MPVGVSCRAWIGLRALLTDKAKRSCPRIVFYLRLYTHALALQVVFFVLILRGAEGATILVIRARD